MAGEGVHPQRARRMEGEGVRPQRDRRMEGEGVRPQRAQRVGRRRLPGTSSSSTQTHPPSPPPRRSHPISLCAEEEHVAFEQALQDASSITATSFFSPQAEAIAQDTIEISQPSGHSLSSSPGLVILGRLLSDWGRSYFIRVDRQGSFHTYPDLGGPFQSLQEADKAIDRHLADARDPKMSVDVTPMENVIRQCLYFPDGTLKKRTRSASTNRTNEKMSLLAHAFLDKYNEDHNLFKDLAYELKECLNYQPIKEDKMWYYHMNFTAKTNGANALDCCSDNLFFAEFKVMGQGKQAQHDDFLVSCICMVNPIDNGQHCYGCTVSENTDMKHPDKYAGEYIAGHSADVRYPFGSCGQWSESEDDEKYVKKKKAMLRRMFRGLDESRGLKKLQFRLPPGATIAEGDWKTRRAKRRLEWETLRAKAQEERAQAARALEARAP